MTKHEFLSRLRDLLTGLSHEDIEGSVDFYGEIIDDIVESGASEEEAVAALGSAEEVAANIRSQASADEDEHDRCKEDHSEQAEEEKTVCDPAAKSGSDENDCPGEDFENIVIDAGDADVRLVLSDSGKLEVDCPDSDIHTFYTVSVENGTLMIKKTEDGKRYNLFNMKWHMHIGINQGSDEITVSLPARRYNKLRVNSSMGCVKADESLSFVSAEINTSYGDVIFSSGVTDELSAKTAYGDLAVTGIAPNKLAVSSTCGDIKLSSVKVVGHVSAWTANGDVKLTDVTCKDLTCGSTAGDTKLRDVIADGSIICTNVHGDIQLNKCDAKSLRLTTKFGDVRGTLLGKKVFTVTTVLGDVSVPSCESGEQCIVTTVCGDVSLSLE